MKKLSDEIGIDLTFDGIMGMSNIDESSGNLVIDQLWRQKHTQVLPNFQFGILLSPRLDEQSVMTLGGFKRDKFNTSYPLVTHGVSGSFHWALHLVRY